MYERLLLVSEGNAYPNAYHTDMDIHTPYTDVHTLSKKSNFKALIIE